MTNKLSVVYSTRKIDSDFLNYIKSTIGVIDSDIIPIENDGLFSLSHAFNIGLEKSIHRYVVYMHDDIIFNTANWGRKVLNHFRRNPEYGIIGVAGSNYLTSGCWWEQRKAMLGIVNHSEHGKIWTSRFSEDQGNKLKQAITLDGVLFAIDKIKLIHKFDESFNGYHFYDQSIVFPNHLDGVKVGVFTDIRITHMSVGHTNDMWEENKKQFEEKYKDKLPCKI